VEAGDRVVVGVNKFQLKEESLPKGLLKVDPAVGEYQKEKIAHLKENRDGEAVAAALKGLKETAQSGENLLPPIIEAARAYATIGEICDVLRGVFGEYETSVIF